MTLSQFVTVSGPFRPDLALRYLATSPSTIAEVVEERCYARAFAARRGPAVARALSVPGGVRVEVAGPGADEAALEQATQLVDRVFGLSVPLEHFDGVREVSQRDPRLAPYVERYHGLRIVTIPDAFEALIWAILGQQINIAFAAKMKRVLIERYGSVVEVGGVCYRLFPPPSRLTDVTAEELRPIQISRQKAWYIAALARAVEDGAIDLAELRALPDEAAIEQLVRLRGIGRWTAEYLLLRGFGRTDAIPAGDMGLRAIVGRLYGLGRNASEAEVRELAERWAPWRGYLGFYLWFALQQRDW